MTTDEIIAECTRLNPTFKIGVRSYRKIEMLVEGTCMHNGKTLELSLVFDPGHMPLDEATHAIAIGCLQSLREFAR